MNDQTSVNSVFFAYAARPQACGEAMAIAAEDLKSRGINAETWQDLHPGGHILIETITSAIDRSQALIAEVSSMNQNVLFEAGYALAKNKALFLSIDESLESARKLWDGVQLLTTIGRLDYHGNGHRLAELVFANREGVEEGGSLLTTLLVGSRAPQFNAVFAPTVPVRFQAADMLDKQLSNWNGIQVLASGDDLGLAPLAYYAAEIYRSSATIFHFMNPERTRAAEHNARSSFLAGMAYGWNRPVLMLAESEYTSPLDYRDLMFTYSTAAKMAKHVEKWLNRLSFHAGSNLRIGRIGMDLELPISSFGQYVAENEDSQLDDYFLPTGEFTSLLDGRADVFVGRKGTGKTATMLQAASDLSQDRRNLVVKIKPTAYELTGLVELVGKFDLQAGIEYLLNNLWIFLLSTEVAIQLLAQADETLAGIGGSGDLTSLDQHLTDMGVNRGDDLATRLENTVESILAQAKMATDDKELRDLVSGALGVHWFKELHRLLRISVVGRYLRIAILVDNLDKAWEKGVNFEATSRFLLALLSAGGQFKKSLIRGTDELDLSLAVFVRADIYEVMTKYAREPDKIGPLTVQWNDPHLLARVLEERYSAKRRPGDFEPDMWKAIFPEEVNGLPAKNYVLWRILPRPRDIVYFGNAALTTAINRRHSVITQDDITMADEAYSRFAFEALVVESDAQGFELEEVLFNFAGLNATMSESELHRVLQESSANLTETKLWLLRTSFLGVELKEGKFVHVEGQSEVDKKLRVARRLSERLGLPMRFRVHPAFRHYLDVRDDDLHTPGYEDITLGGDS